MTQTLSRVPNEAGESALGDVIADAQLAATKDAKDGSAVIAFTNPGGIRTDIVPKENGAISFGELFASQPFRNRLVTMTLTGSQLKDMLEQQWLDPKRPRILQVSNGFSYPGMRRNHSASESHREDDAQRQADRAGSGYRVTVNDYLAVGGDGFTAAKQGTAQQYGGYDADALFAFFRAHGPIGPLPPSRILRVN